MITGGSRPDGKSRWTSLTHKGVCLSAPFAELGIPVSWKGTDVTLSPEAEFYLSEFVRRGGQTRIPSSSGLTASLFGSKRAARIFWEDWRALLPKGSPIASLAELDVSKVATALKTRKQKNKGDHPTCTPYSHARVNGRLQPVAPFAVDRPGIFFGRSNESSETLNGKLRRRIVAEDVTLNLGSNARIPQVPLNRGKRWGKVVHEPNVDWVASWRDPVTGVVKYARLGVASDSEQASTKAKYDLARKMIRETPKLRTRIAAALGSSERKRRQLGAVLWIVDRLALRIGSGNASAAKRAGAHGAATLLVKHLTFRGRSFTLSFPGKDCVHYERTVENAPVELVKVLMDAARSKDAADPLFDLVDSNTASEAIDSVVPGATSKVLRTARASELFRQTLEDDLLTDCDPKLALLFAFTRVAILLNHRRATKAGNLGGGDLTELERKTRELMNVVSDKGKAAKLLRAEVVDAARLSLATAKGSYIDPRLVFEFGRRHGIADPGGSTLAKKFPWAAKKNSALE